jgi:hypothetical protein
MQRRRYISPGPGYPVQPNPGGMSILPAGAALPPSQWHEIPKVDEEGPQNLILPIPFDYDFIQASPATGSTVFLVSDGVNSTAGAVSSTVPLGMRGVVDGIFPYLEGASGPITQARIPGLGVAITWSLFVNGKPDRAYGAITTILAPWGTAMSERTLIFLRPGEQLTCAVTYTDPNAVYQFVGIRVKGLWIPMEKEARGGGR